MNEEIRARAKELLELANRIDDKLNQVQILEDEIEKLQVYRNERGDQLLHGIIDSKNYAIKEEEKIQ